MKRATFALGALLLGCGSDTVPEVEILEVTPAQIVAADDAANDVSLRARYADGDGDLGDGFAEVHDCRAEGLVTELDLPPIANEQAVADGVAIDGEIVLLVSDVSELAPGAPGCGGFAGAVVPAPGQLSFCVVLVDAAGNRSEPDCTEPIDLAAE